MKNGTTIIQKINLLGSKANELIIKNKNISSQLIFYQELFNLNKNYISEYFNIISQKKIIEKNNTNNKSNIKANNNEKIKNILVKYNSEIKSIYQKNIQNIKNNDQKYNIYKKKLISQTSNLIDKKTEISEDNFLYENTLKAKDNFIFCLQKDLKLLKLQKLEDVKYVYLNFNYYNMNNSSSNKNNNKNIINNFANNKNNKSAIFEKGENAISTLLNEEKRKFYLGMKQRINTRHKFGRLKIKKNALNDLVTSFSFINETQITNGLNNNTFQLLNKKIGGVVENYQKIFDYEIIDENFFIFMPFEMEINKDEINEIMQTDITLDLSKNKKDNIKINKKIPKLNFLQIEFNKEKVEFSEEDEEGDIDNNNNIKYRNNDLDYRIKDMKSKIQDLKIENKRMKTIINDFIKFQEKIKGKFEIFEKMMINKKQNTKNDDIP